MDKTNKITNVKDLESLEMFILLIAKDIDTPLEIGGILIRTAHKLRLLMEDYDEKLKKKYNLKTKKMKGGEENEKDY